MPTTVLAPAGARDSAGLDRFPSIAPDARGRAGARRGPALPPVVTLMLVLALGALFAGCATAPPPVALDAARSGPTTSGPATPDAASLDAATLGAATPAGPTVAQLASLPGPAVAPLPEQPLATPEPQDHAGFFSRLGGAARHALTDPGTWAPAAGAAVIGIAGLDQPITDWATRTNPIFGSQENARHASDVLRNASEFLMVGTTLARTYTPDFQAWGPHALQDAVIGTGIAGFGSGMTAGIKTLTGRQRPDGSDSGSLPSGHATTASALATLSRGNIARMDLPPAPSWILQAGATTLAAGVAWGRVEGDKHYTSDVLAGWAVGHFLGSMLSEAWLGPVRKHGLDLSVGPDADGGYGMQVGWKF